MNARENKSNKNKRDNKIPSRDFALFLLKKVKLPFSIRRHSISVANRALKIAKKIKKVEVNKKLVEIGGLLHDIGRAKSHGFDHGLIGGRILRSYGFSERLARICETHLLGGLDKEDAKRLGLPIKDYLPKTLEEKIVCLADKHMKGRHEVSIEERFEKWFRKYGKTIILLKSKRRVEQIQKEIKALF
jgi:uncharacterized protein